MAPTRGPHLGLLLVLLGAPAGLRAEEPPEKTTTNVPAFWSKIQIWDYAQRAPQFGWSFDFVLRTQGTYQDANIFQHRLRESYRPWFVWAMNPLYRLSIAPLSYHRDDGLRWSESTLGGQVRHELRSTLELDGSAFLHKRVMISHRYRFESRLLDPTGAPSHFFRARLRLRARVSFNNKSFYERGVVYGFTYAEVGVHLGRAAPWAFNQLRSFGGLGYRFGGYTRVELGYVNQWRGGAGAPRYHSNHGPMLYLMFDYLSGEIRAAKARRARRRAPPQPEATPQHPQRNPYKPRPGLPDPVHPGPFIPPFIPGPQEPAPVANPSREL